MLLHVTLANVGSTVCVIQLIILFVHNVRFMNVVDLFKHFNNA